MGAGDGGGSPGDPLPPQSFSAPTPQITPRRFCCCSRRNSRRRSSSRSSRSTSTTTTATPLDCTRTPSAGHCLQRFFTRATFLPRSGRVAIRRQECAQDQLHQVQPILSDICSLRFFTFSRFRLRCVQPIDPGNSSALPDLDLCQQQSPAGYSQANLFKCSQGSTNSK